MILSFAITPIFLFMLESENIDVVMALDVMKQDILGKFGVAFEDLTKGSNETLDDVADYEETKKELRNAVLAPDRAQGDGRRLRSQAREGHPALRPSREPGRRSS